MTDTWAQRTADDFTQVIAGELPTGAAWPRDPDGDLMKWCAGSAQIWGDVSARAAALLITESDPRDTLEMLPDWEAAFGLPDPCVAEQLSITDRRKALVTKMTALGGQSRAFFITVAAALGYQIAIQEYSPFMCGISRIGDTSTPAPQNSSDTFQRWMLGPPENRFYWTVYVTGAKLRWFRAGTGQCGLDPLLQVGIATDLECVIRRWKPAHTQVIFNYGSVATLPATYEWFRAGESHVGVDPMLTVIESSGLQDT